MRKWWVTMMYKLRTWRHPGQRSLKQLLEELGEAEEPDYNNLTDEQLAGLPPVLPSR